MNTKVEISWQGRNFSLLADRAIHWPSQKTLFIADPHFGKAATFRKSGIPVPERTTQDDCDRLTQLVEETSSRTIIFLGDFFHARIGKTEEVRKILTDWRKNLSSLQVHLVRGNHDLSSGDPWPELQINVIPTRLIFSVLNAGTFLFPDHKSPTLPDISIPVLPLREEGKTKFVPPASILISHKLSFLHLVLSPG